MTSWTSLQHVEKASLFLSPDSLTESRVSVHFNLCLLINQCSRNFWFLSSITYSNSAFDCLTHQAKSGPQSIEIASMMCSFYRREHISWRFHNCPTLSHLLRCIAMHPMLSHLPSWKIRLSNVSICMVNWNVSDWSFPWVFHASLPILLCSSKQDACRGWDFKKASRHFSFDIMKVN